MAPSRTEILPAEEPATLSAHNLKVLNGDSQDPYGHYFPADPETLNLESNYGPMESDMIGYLQPTTKDTPIEVMHERFERDGYLFVKGCINKEASLDCRRDYFTHMAPSGLLQEGSDPVDGIYSGADTRKYLPPGNLRRLFGLKDDPDSERYVDLMISAHEANFYVEFCESKQLHDFVRQFTGWKNPHMLQRTMLRAFVPNSELTPVHFDQMYLRAGPPTSLTAWIPIGDVSLEGGGLMYLQGSTDVGKKTEDDFAKNAHNLTDEERVSAFNKNMNDGGFLSRDTVAYGKETQRKWLIAEYEAGDVIFHNPYMVHASCKNRDPENKIRLATDVRFVDPEKPYDTRWMKVYRPLDGL
ncbi:phytanoyl-CoA hydroxylase [Fusarium oxysporum NRRL 32931]|uniref:Phytanoyl-CoA hydroxylase n=1 Tax=Fusarium oxysporum NRRL 32931 TaxID=660029 RepID=W9I446_FUSOX|nr:phytanoyl-CoA hydroxylase [Fusarium oxysporum NRRL 32931]